MPVADKNLTFRCSPLAIQFAEGSAPTLIQLFKAGTFHHPKFGTFNITPEVLAQMKKNFDDNVRGIALALDFAHESDKEAAAWFEGLELTENGTQLWARVQWTPKGGEVVQGKAFRYISPDFTFNYKDTETLKEFGPTLLGAGLTNRPFLKGMAPVELSEGGNEKMDEKDKIIEQLQAELAALRAQMATGAEKEVEFADMKKKLAAFEAKAAEDKKIADQAACDKALAEKKSEFDVLLSEGKAVEAQREAFMSGDTVAYAKNAAALNLSEKGHGDAGHGDAVLSASQEVLKLAHEKVAKDKITFSEAVRAVAIEKPELFAKYREETNS